MNAQSDFVIHYQDNSSPLSDVFTHKTEATIKDATSATDSFIDIPLLDTNPIQHSSVSITPHLSIFNSFPVLSDASPQPDQLSEDTLTSGFFSETTTNMNNTSPKTSTAGEPTLLNQQTPLDLHKFIYKAHTTRREIQKPPTTAGIKLQHLKEVFDLERPMAEKKLGLKRTTFSNLSRHYGISKWPFRTIRDARNRMEANKAKLENANLSKEKRRKLQRQQKYLTKVIENIYEDPQLSRDSNTLAVLLKIAEAKDGQ